MQNKSIDLQMPHSQTARSTNFNLHEYWQDSWRRHGGLRATNAQM